MSEEVLEGGWSSTVTRVGGEVRRDRKPQSQTVMALLGHLRSAGCDMVPEPRGFDSEGRERLTYVEGQSPHPEPWPDEALEQLGAMIAQIHRASTSFEAPPEACWQPRFTRDLSTDRLVFGHGDLGPWNVMARDGLPVGIIDWDRAGPVDAMWELAEAAWLNVQLHDDEVAAIAELGSPEERARQLRLFLDGYGLETPERIGFVDRMIEIAVRTAREEALDSGITPTTPSPRLDGFPLLWAVTWRARAAAWMLDHRRLLERAIA